MLAGRIAEEVIFGRITSGAFDDLQKVYEVAKNMVIKFGMSDILGNIGFKEDEMNKIYSNDTQNIIDNEIGKIVKEASDKTRILILKHKETLQKYN